MHVLYLPLLLFTVSYDFYPCLCNKNVVSVSLIIIEVSTLIRLLKRFEVFQQEFEK